ncbi:MAG TPA: DNRLRE domain-containing protein [Gemmatimonadota bacterium]
MPQPCLRAGAARAPAGRDRRLAAAAWLVLAVVVGACSEDDENPVGADELPQLSDSIQEVVLFPVQATSFETPSSDRVFGDTLVAAQDLPDAAGYESRVLMRFALAIADTSRGPVTVDSAQVRLLVTSVAPDSLRFVLNRVTESWSEEEVSWDERSFGVPWSTPGVTFDPTPVLEGTLVADSSFFSLPDTLVQRWLDEPQSNAGLVLRVETAGGAGRFRAASTTGLTNENGPRIRLFLTVGDSSSVAGVLATNDAYVTEFRGTTLPGITVGVDPFVRSLLKFDLSAVPPNASINLAELRLVPRQVVTPLDSLRLELRRVVSPELGGGTVFTNNDVFIVVSDTIRADSAITITSVRLSALVRLWQASATFNQGLGLQTQRRNPAAGANLVPSGNLGFAVFGDASAPLEDQPRLRIIFTPALQSDLDRARR